MVFSSVGIDANLAEHPAVGGRVFAHVLVGGADFAPRLAAVVAAIDFRSLDPRFHDRAAVRVALAFLRGPAGFVAVDEGVEHFRVRGGGVEADPAAHRCRRQAAVRVGPAAAAVCRFPDAALARARLDARVAPLAPRALPGCRVQRVRVRWIHHQIDGAGARALVEHLRPRPPAVGRLEDAAHLVLGPGVSGRRDVDDVRVGRVDQDAGDRVRVGEAGVAEGAAAVARLEHADPGHGRAKQVRLTRAYIQDGRIGLRHRDVADARARLMLEDGPPRGAAIVRLPDAARRERGVDASHRSDVCDRDVGGAAGDVRRSEVLPWNSAGRRRLRHRRVDLVGLANEVGVGSLRLLTVQQDDERQRRNEKGCETFHWLRGQERVQSWSASPSLAVSVARKMRCASERIRTSASSVRPGL